MKYLVVDGMLSGPGIRDLYEGGYITPKNLGVSEALAQKIDSWLSRYHIAHYDGYKDIPTLEGLDAEGIEIAKMLLDELTDTKIDYYYSDWKSQAILI